MNMARIIGLAILVVGIILLVFGINATNSVSENVVEGVTGKYTDKTMWFIIGGIAGIIIGIGMATVGPRLLKRKG